MNLSNAGMDFIKRWETCKLKAYEDQAGIWTIGYGSIFYEDGSRVEQGDIITQERADKLFRTSIVGLPEAIDALVAPVLNQNQLDSLVSFVYNVGLTAFRKSTLRKVINTTMDESLLREGFLMWTKYHTDGCLRPSEGLRNRRIAEWKLFISPMSLS